MIQFQEYLSSDYPGFASFIDTIIKPIFGDGFRPDADLQEMIEYPDEIEDFDLISNSHDEDFRQLAQDCNVTRLLKLGIIRTSNGIPIHVYDITVGSRKHLARNRKGIQEIIRRNSEMTNQTGAFMLFHYADTTWEWRFSYCYVGRNREDTTSAKRYTYLLGRGQSCKTAALRFQTLLKKKGKIAMDDITEAFSVESVSKEFFDQYRLNYADIVCYVTGKRMVKLGGKWEEKQEHEPNEFIMNQFAQFADPEKAVRDYVKKLMGRLVFLQFIQKKGWLGVPMDDASWTQGDKEFIQHLFAQYEDKDNFIDDVLEPLFNDINSRRSDDKANSVLGAEIKVPYLNGGLFEKDAEDDTTFPLPAKYMQDMLDFFSAYNFTIDENDPNDAEVGVDPEMLGRVFENLLEDNKDKGAFYTPKEIVQYMCRESLIAYLQTDIEDDAAKLSFRDFVTTHEVSALNPADVYKVDKKLREVKICDPAIGSGAFPMGLLKELFDCRMAIEGEEEGKTPAEIKKDIIQNSIYGVDIEKGAVDIARLRFWLSLIIDEQTPHALPNMDFKIMQGNSLLEQYMGVPLDDIYDSSRQMMLAFDEETTARLLLKEHMFTYFEKEDHEEKAETLKGIDNAVKAMVKAKTLGNPEVSAAIDALNLRNNQEFFLWHTWFNDVLADKKDAKGKPIKGTGGFDIVIGNPPYINVELIPADDKELYKKYFKCFYKRSDIFALFLENALMNLSNKKAVCTFIIPSVIHTNMSYQPLRDIILNNKWLREVCYTGGKVFNAPTVDTTILVLHKVGVDEIVLKNAVDFSNHTIHSVKANYFKSFQNIISIGEGDADGIYKKLFNPSFLLLGDHFNMFQGIVTGLNPAYIFENLTDALTKGIDECLLHTFVQGKDIAKFAIKSKEKRILYLCNDIDIEDYRSTKEWIKPFKSKLSERREAKKGTIKWYSLQWPRAKKDLDIQQKILLQRTRNEALKTRIVATIDDQGVYGAEGIYFIIPVTDEISLPYLLGVLNSTLMNYLFATRFLNLAIKTEYVKSLRIPIKNKDLVNSVETLVNQILSAKKSNPQSDTSAEEQEIDQLVYKLYNLTPEEIAIVEGKNE